MSKNSDANAAANEAEKEISQLLGRRRSGTVVLEGEEIRVRCAGVGKLKRQDTGEMVDPFSCLPIETKKTELDHLDELPQGEPAAKALHVHSLDACVGHMPTVPNVLAAE